MSLQEQIVTVAMVVLGTQITRFIAFICFPSSKRTPEFVVYLGKVLPGAVFALLVVYCFKNVEFTCGNYGLPELFGVAVTALVHIKFRQFLISMAAGTAAYMILLQTLFALS